MTFRRPDRRDLLALLRQAERLLRLIGGAWWLVPGFLRFECLRLADRIAETLTNSGHKPL